MRGEAKELAVLWGCWLLFGVKTVPHRYNSDIADTIFLVLFGLFTLIVLGMTVRFLYLLGTVRGRASEPPAAASGHEETASESP
ncbi:hypothetical protein ABZV60_07820 [Streptomyces sp. NPDC004787]|uniref:hypothetical protein n=1 Tax=Streptomyces sp. NPDC004787 TaxID=3154291 RepID=UPI0033A20647